MLAIQLLKHFTCNISQWLNLMIYIENRHWCIFTNIGCLQIMKKNHLQFLTLVKTKDSYSVPGDMELGRETIFQNNMQTFEITGMVLDKSEH